MSTIRLATGIVGIAVAVIGAWYLVDLGPDNLFATLRWLVAGVIAHDALLAPATIGVVILAARAFPGWLRAPATVGFVVLGTVTLLAIPVLGRFGARTDNPTLLDRDYRLGWVAVASVVMAGAAIAAAVRRRAGGRAEKGERR